MKFCKPEHGPPGVEATWFATILDELFSIHHVRATFEAPPWSEWFNQLLQFPQSEAPGDLIYMPGGWIPALATMGGLTDLTVSCAGHIDAWQQWYPSDIWRQGEYQRKQYGIPVYGATWCFLYNREMLNHAGWEQPPQTWPELMACAADVTRGDSNLWAYGISDDTDGHFADHGFVYLFAGGLAELEQDGWCHLDNAASIEGLEVLVEMVHRGLAPVPHDMPSWRVFDQFLAGNIAMTVGPSDLVLRQRATVPDFPLGVSLMPAPVGGQQLSLSSCGFYCIPVGTSFAASATLLLERLLEPANLAQHVQMIGMLPIQTGSTAYDGDAELSTFCSQVTLSGRLPTWPVPYTEWLAAEMIACLRLEQSATTALRRVTERINQALRDGRGT